MSKSKAYSVDFKLEVIKFAENYSNRETGRKFKIDKSIVHKWKDKKAKLVEIHELPGPSKKKLKFGCGRKPILSTIENELMEKNCI